jgi:RNA-dependent RNA polymerase
MADLWSPQVALPDKVEQLLQKICKDQKQAPPRADVRQKLASLGEEAALGILREISASSIRKSLGGFILYMINKLTSTRVCAWGELEFRKAFLILSYIGE